VHGNQLTCASLCRRNTWTPTWVDSYCRVTWKISNSSMNVASLVKLCLPLPPTPSKRAFPRGSPMTRHIRDVCSMASRNKTNFMGALLMLLYSSKYDSATFCKVGISVTCSPQLKFRHFVAPFGYMSRHRMIQTPDTTSFLPHIQFQSQFEIEPDYLWYLWYFAKSALTTKHL